MKTAVKFICCTLVCVIFIVTYILILPASLRDRHANLFCRQLSDRPISVNRGAPDACPIAPLTCTFGRVQLQCAVDVENKTGIYVPLHLASRTADVTGEYEHSSSNVHDQSRSVFRLYLTQYSYYRPIKPYRTSDKFLSFANYHVESRDRVKCISAEYGVPLSIQWKRAGHYYATQIAQFGLQHYSQYLKKSGTSANSRSNAFEINRLQNYENRAFFDTAKDAQKNSAGAKLFLTNVPPLKFGSDTGLQCASWNAENSAGSQSLQNFSVFVLSLLCPDGCRFSLELEFPAVFVVPVRLQYDALSATLASEQLSASVNFDDNGIARSIDINYFMLNARTEYVQLIRDVKYDVEKGIALLFEKGHNSVSKLLNRILVPDAVLQHEKQRLSGKTWPPKKSKLLKAAIDLRKFRITKLELCGAGFVSPQLKLFSADDAEPLKLNFFKAADWLLRHQHADGSWRVNATHYIAAGANNRFNNEDNSSNVSAGLVLRPGWCSAMAQGHALSVLSRAYLLSKTTVLCENMTQLYQTAAQKALQVFSRAINNNSFVSKAHPDDEAACGVMSKFPGNITWFEEYPTTPPIFVLNGFLYSLFGSYDAASVFDDDIAKRLWLTGMQSLSTLLPLYDTGSGSWYDLRHFSVRGDGSVLPNRARWDYHVTHITQLLALGTIAHSFNDNGRRRFNDGANWPLSTHSDISNLLNTIAERWITYTEGYRVPHN